MELDLGSRAIKMAVFREGVLVGNEVVESSFEPHIQAAKMVSRYRPSLVVATGYGRHLAQKHFAQKVITEIKATPRGRSTVCRVAEPSLTLVARIRKSSLLTAAVVSHSSR